MKYKKIAVGGSFNILHRGHRALLDRAFDAGEYVLIGLTSNEMVEKKILPYEKRKEALQNFLGGRGRYSIVKLKDPLGDAVRDREIGAIIVSKETVPGAHEINEARKKRGLRPLEIISIPMVLAEDGEPISSTRIKSGKIDREGRVLPKGNQA